jgi:2'-5' RNA ligase
MDEYPSNSAARLFLAAVPDPNTAARIHQLAGILKRAHKFSGKLIAPERLHVSLFFLGGLSEPDIEAACAAAAEVRAEPFEVLFDRTASFRGKRGSRPFVLVGDDGLQRLESFRRMLGAAMMRSGLRRVANSNFTPHVTLLYGIMAQTPQGPESERPGGLGRAICCMCSVRRKFPRNQSRH